jgi:hypothetical protein
VNVRAGLGEREGQRAQSRPNLEYLIVGSDVSQARNTPHGVGVDHEVLTEGARGLKTVIL